MQIEIDVCLTQTDKEKKTKAISLIDSGCTMSCVNKEFVETHQIATSKMTMPIPALNADGTANSAGMITEYCKVRMTLKDHEEHLELPVVNLGQDNMFLGFDWLVKHKPEIDWKT